MLFRCIDRSSRRTSAGGSDGLLSDKAYLSCASSANSFYEGFKARRASEGKRRAYHSLQNLNLICSRVGLSGTPLDSGGEADMVGPG